ncbi:bifunctional diaminohydroxyphosphoribosylaminopyrimidine deaminase/5-amino-6-(5-phosphoribosylamino)uracil reductase, partial [Klebsiella pneumoniae]|nr:bifunctional diaminohydroxyphosphoribosylaminopyrimidine deaminase/5-amino-6-(5-phosphoribosylamino)uracil reductase [Klebsiella pneumoniae]
MVIGCTDPNPKVNGKGIKKLTEAGVEVILYKSPEEAMNFNQIFLKNMAQELPYVILKFACSQDH